MIFAVLAVSSRFALAQEPITLDEIKPGEISDANPLPGFDFVAAPGQNLEIEVLAITEGMVPQFTLLQENDAIGVWYALPPQNAIKSAVTFEEGGPYRILVSTTNGTQGQFVITLRQVVPPPMLIVGAPTGGPLMQGESITYLLQADSRMTLSVSGAGIAAELLSADGDVLGSLTSDVAGGGFYLPGGSYSVEVRNATADASTASYQLSLVPGE